MSAEIEKARRELTDRVMGREGVEGTAVTERDGRPCLVVYVSDAGVRRGIPGRVRGVPVVVEETGPFRGL